MRKTVRLMSETGPEQRLAEAVTQLPHPVRQVLADVAERTDLPLAAGSWRSGDSGCLVANVVASLAPEPAGDAAGEQPTLDLRMLELVPEMSSRDLNLLIVAWDEAAEQAGVTGDVGLRALLRGALGRVGVGPSEDSVVSPVPAAPSRLPSLV